MPPTPLCVFHNDTTSDYRVMEGYLCSPKVTAVNMAALLPRMLCTSNILHSTLPCSLLTGLRCLMGVVQAWWSCLQLNVSAAALCSLCCFAAKSGWRYPLESHLHELLLQSPHRTLDPEV